MAEDLGEDTDYLWGGLFFSSETFEDDTPEFSAEGFADGDIKPSVDLVELTTSRSYYGARLMTGYKMLEMED
jgi:hypothetical protein